MRPKQRAAGDGRADHSVLPSAPFQGSCAQGRAGLDFCRRHCPHSPDGCCPSLFHQWEEGALDWKAEVELGEGETKGEGHCSSVSAFGIVGQKGVAVYSSCLQ